MTPVPGWPGVCATSDGKLYSTITRRRWLAGREYGRFKGKNGYVQCNARAPNDIPAAGIRSGQKVQVHVLVCLAFHGLPPSPKHEPHHKNGVRDDNRPENLCWVTRRENIQHALDVGTMPQGSKHHDAVLTEDRVRFIREAQRSRTHSQAVLAAMFGVSPSTIQSAVDRRAWKHVA